MIKKRNKDTLRVLRRSDFQTKRQLLSSTVTVSSKLKWTETFKSNSKNNKKRNQRRMIEQSKQLTKFKTLSNPKLYMTRMVTYHWRNWKNRSGDLWKARGSSLGSEDYKI